MMVLQSRRLDFFESEKQQQKQKAPRLQFSGALQFSVSYLSIKNNIKCTSKLYSHYSQMRLDKCFVSRNFTSRLQFAKN